MSMVKIEVTGVMEGTDPRGVAYLLVEMARTYLEGIESGGEFDDDTHDHEGTAGELESIADELEEYV